MARSVLILFCLMNLAVAYAAENTDQTNIVLIVSDYMGYHDTEPYGATDVRTPSLARLASEGVTMTAFYAAAPVCGLRVQHCLPASTRLESDSKKISVRTQMDCPQAFPRCRGG